MTPLEIDGYAKAILGSARIRGKIVVLCEGEVFAPSKLSGSLSPQVYKSQERFPDSNFYSNCLPRAWRNNRPRFINGGGRAEVLRLYQTLLQLHERDSEISNLEPDRLHAMVDLDLQPHEIGEYPWTSTEHIHADLYRNSELTNDIARQHRIWVTAMIHKEAYFLLPSVERVLQQRDSPIYFDGAPLHLRDLHLRAAERIALREDQGADHDRDLHAHFQVAQARLARFDIDSLRASTPSALSESWISAVRRPHVAEYERLCRFLFTITKAKRYWNELEPDPQSGWARPVEEFREQLELSIAREIARLTPGEHPVAGFLSWLRHAVPERE